MLRVSSAAASHPGLRREENEDAYCARPDLGLFLVADGMGGHAAGEVAARLVVETVEASVVDTREAGDDTAWPLPYQPRLGRTAKRLSMALSLANRRIGEAIAADPALTGMATTAAAVLLDETGSVVAHVGDSRVYRWRDGTLSQLTADHSWVAEQLRAGTLTAAEAERHPWRNVVTRALTGGAEPALDVADLDPRAGDRLMLCSDGLSGVVPDAALARILADAASAETACARLIEAANEAGGPDNITVAVLNLDVA